MTLPPSFLALNLHISGPLLSCILIHAYLCWFYAWNRWMDAICKNLCLIKCIFPLNMKFLIHFDVFGSSPSSKFEFHLWNALRLGIFWVIFKGMFVLPLFCFCLLVVGFSPFGEVASFFPKNLFFLHYMRKHYHFSHSVSMSLHLTSHSTKCDYMFFTSFAIRTRM